ncbi:MAG: replication initiation factor domain-containing protein [Oscillospiraceae bacterium]
MKKEDFCVIFDWFSFTAKGYQLPEFLDFCGLSDVDFVDCQGHYGYKRAKFYNGIWVLYDGSDGSEGPFAEDMGICLELTGQGCREFESLENQDLETFINFVAVCEQNDEKNFNITRLDVAFDDIDKEGNGLLDIDKIESVLLEPVPKQDKLFVSKFKKVSGSWTLDLVSEKDFLYPAKTLYFGSEKSEVRFRIYDKAQERGGLGYHWIRFEMQLRRERAFNFLVSELVLGERFCGVINNYLRFVEPSATDSNKWRWKNAEWWNEFLCTLEKISLFTKKDAEYNLGRVENYIEHYAGNCIDVLIQCVGLSAFLDLIRERKSELNSKQEQLISEYKLHQQKRLNELYEQNPHFINF